MFDEVEFDAAEFEVGMEEIAQGVSMSPLVTPRRGRRIGDDDDAWLMVAL